MTTGVTLKIALDAAAGLSEQGLDVAVLHVPTNKPPDTDTVLNYGTQAPIIATIGEHTVIAGLGSAVAEIVVEANLNLAKRFKRIGIPDVFPDEYGSQATLMQRYSITA